MRLRTAESGPNLLKGPSFCSPLLCRHRPAWRPPLASEAAAVGTQVAQSTRELGALSRAEPRWRGTLAGAPAEIVLGGGGVGCVVRELCANHSYFGCGSRTGSSDLVFSAWTGGPVVPFRGGRKERSGCQKGIPIRVTWNRKSNFILQVFSSKSNWAGQSNQPEGWVSEAHEIG